MSLPDPSLNNVEKRKPAPAHYEALFADSNAVLQKAIQQLPSAIRSAIILRCDELAHLQINEGTLENVFSQILALITEGREPETKLFLHITCSRKTNQERGKTGGLSRFRIQFHTNLTPLAGRIEEAERRMNAIVVLLLPFDGSLAVNQLKHSGSVFILNLPGK